MQGNIINTYTNEKVSFIAGAEFGPFTGHTMVIVRALYGLCLRGLHFHDKLSDTFHIMGFSHSFGDHDVWMQTSVDSDDMYNYIIVHVDDLFMSMMDPQAFFDALQSAPWNYKLKGIGDP